MKRSLRLALPLITCSALLTACPGNGDGGVTPPPLTDTTAPTVALSASQSGRVVTLSATAQDNVGVTRVDFYSGDLLITSDTSAPYSVGLNLTTQSGVQNYTAKAYDAAGNVGVGGAQLTLAPAPAPATLYQGVWGWGLVDASDRVVDEGAVIFDEEGTFGSQKAALGAYMNDAQTRLGYSVMGEIQRVGSLDVAFSANTNVNDSSFYFIGVDTDSRMGSYQGMAIFEGGGAIFDAQGNAQEVAVVLFQVSTTVPASAQAQEALKAQARAQVAKLAAQRPAGLVPLKTSSAVLRDAARAFLK
ncbi:Ig-like domain-containing protein [Deinococcus arcticus]|uniref:Uncharacterized protein n=1 Tax=Deinococcus arcticus TaxID=2136176 RepID=A0A2T3W882_9DEIO|nr:Ig-like domain-containing protein [Deinococcus arcticus]PTA68120.1 hypothetical protein C8263_08570 [Deinococcus arcticus]